MIVSRDPARTPAWKRRLALLAALAWLAGCSSNVPFPAQIRHAQVDGHRVAWSLSGQPLPGRPTMVLVSGLGSDQRTFAPVLEGLARHGPVIAYDRLGYGESGPPPDGPRDAVTMAAELHALLQRTGVPGPYVLVGHSLGGLIAEYYASTYPWEVAGLVLDDARPADYELRCVAALGEERCADPWWVDWVLLLTKVQAREFRALDATQTQVRQATPPRGLPSLVLVGAKQNRGEDLVKVWLDSQAGLAAKYGARQVVFRDSGHFIHKEKSGEFVELVGGFVDSLAAE